MNFAFLPDWSGFLPRDGGHLIVLRGGGGKTALMAALAKALAAADVPVALARSGADGPLGIPGLDRRPVDTLSGPAPDRLHVVAPDGGAGGLDPAAVDVLGAVLPEHVVLYEADSGCGRPVARSAAVALPTRTSLLITVVGLGAIGRPAPDPTPTEAPLPEAWLTPTDAGPVWSWDGLLALLDDLPDRPVRAAEPPPALIALLGLDACRDSLGLFDCLGRLMVVPGRPLVLLGDTSGPEPRLRTAYALAPESP